MASFPSSVDDPEKHFLGNLLDEDSSFSNAASPLGISRTTTTSHNFSSASPPQAYGNSVRNLQIWPEPPPPYSAPNEPWQGSLRPTPARNTFGFDQSTSSSLLNDFTNDQLREPSEWGTNMFGSDFPLSQFSGHSSSLAQPTIIAQPQIHHHHHNLHHHTHTHNVVENHHHYVTSPPGLLPEIDVAMLLKKAPVESSSAPGSTIRPPKSVHATPSNGKTLIDSHAVSNGSVPAATAATEVHHHHHHHVAPVSSLPVVLSPRDPETPISPNCVSAIGEGRKVKPALSPKEKLEQIVSPHSAPITARMPFSYRDVAARSDSIFTSAVNPQNNKRSAAPAPEYQEIKTSATKSSESISSEHRGHVSREPKDDDGRTPQFKKITRKTKSAVVPEKKKAPVKTVLSDHFVLPPQPTSVEDQTKYDVLKSLLTPVKDLQPSVPPTPVKDDVFERGDAETSDVLQRRRMNQANADKKKNVSVVDQVQTKKKTGTVKKGRIDHGGFQCFYTMVVMLFQCVEGMLKWITTLVVDLCQQCYELTCYGCTCAVYGVVDCIQRGFIIIAGYLYSYLLWFRNLKTKMTSRDPTVDDSFTWGLEENLQIPSNAYDALDRILRSRAHDAYGFLGLRANCSDDDIHRHVKRLTAIFEAEKLTLDGAACALEVIAKASQAIGTDEARKAYNLTTLYKNSLHKELLESYAELHECVHTARNSMFCECGQRHARLRTSVKACEARYCSRCSCRHAARSNDIWVETRLFGLIWVYFTCSEGIVYDITSWATCEQPYQTNNLRHLRPNLHNVVCRLNARTDTFRPGGDVALSAEVVIVDQYRQEWVRAGPMMRGSVPDEDRSRRAANRRQKKHR